MLIRRLFALFTGLMIALTLLTPSLSRAQTEPDSLIDSILSDLSQRLGHEFDRGNSNWNWAETKYSDSSLGCPKAGQTYKKGVFLGYQITVIYKGITYDYRAPEDNSNSFFLCKPDSLPSAPVITLVPTVPPPTATLIPTATVYITPIPTTNAITVNLTVAPGSAAAPVSYTNPLAYVGADGNIYITSLDSTTTTAITSDGRGSKPTWSPDGAMISFRDGDGLFVAQSGRLPQLIVPRFNSAILWLSGGKAIGYELDKPGSLQGQIVDSELVSIPPGGGNSQVVIPQISRMTGMPTAGPGGLIDSLYVNQFGLIGSSYVVRAVAGGYLYGNTTWGTGYTFVGSDGQTAWKHEDLFRAAIAPDGQHIAALKYLNNPPSNYYAAPDLVLLDPATGNETVIGQANAIDQVGWSSDNAVILYSTRVPAMSLLPPKDIQAANRLGLNLNGPPFDLDNNFTNDLQVFSVGLYKMPVGGGSATALYQDNGSAIGAITASGDGTTIAFTEIPTTQALIDALNNNLPTDQARAAVAPQLVILSLADGKARHLGPGTSPAFGHGSFAVAGGFVAPTNTPTSTPVQCPGAPVSRLTAGATGHVTPGSPNNLRSSPTGAVIGQIPGSAEFQVLQGPTCLKNTAWWQVNYNGLIGWTAEGQGSTYYLQP